MVCIVWKTQLITCSRWLCHMVSEVISYNDHDESYTANYFSSSRKPNSGQSGNANLNSIIKQQVWLVSQRNGKSVLCCIVSGRMLKMCSILPEYLQKIRSGGSFLRPLQGAEKHYFQMRTLQQPLSTPR